MIQGLVNLISTDTTYTTAMGGNVYPMLLPEGTSLGTTYRVVGGSSEPTFTTSGPQKVRMEFDCYAPTYAQADAGRTLLRTLLEGFNGLLSDGTFLQDVLFIQPIDKPFDQDSKLYRLAAEFYFMFNLTA